MAIDQAKLGVVAAKLMEQLDTYGEDAELGAIMLLAAVDHENGTQTTVHYTVSEDLAVHEGIGLLQHVQNNLSWPQA